MGWRFGSKLYCVDFGEFLFFCPGCGEKHRFTTYESGSMLQWQFNDNGDAPTIQPSLIIQYGMGGRICHMFVTDGHIEYLPDTYHYLSGQTIEMVDWLDAEDE